MKGERDIEGSENVGIKEDKGERGENVEEWGGRKGKIYRKGMR